MVAAAATITGSFCRFSLGFMNITARNAIYYWQRSAHWSRACLARFHSSKTHHESTQSPHTPPINTSCRSRQNTFLALSCSSRWPKYPTLHSTINCQLPKYCIIVWQIAPLCLYAYLAARQIIIFENARLTRTARGTRHNHAPRPIVRLSLFLLG